MLLSLSKLGIVEWQRRELGRHSKERFLLIPGNSAPYYDTLIFFFCSVQFNKWGFLLVMFCGVVSEYRFHRPILLFLAKCESQLSYNVPLQHRISHGLRQQVGCPDINWWTAARWVYDTKSVQTEGSVRQAIKTYWSKQLAYLFTFNIKFYPPVRPKDHF